MEIIALHHPYEKKSIPDAEVVLVLGFFDGVHRGHQEVIETGRKLAAEKKLKLAVMTFNHHPAVVFKKVKDNPVKYLSSLRQKEERMAALGVDFLYEVDFTSAFSAQKPQAFVDHYIVALHAKVAVAGFDYTYGKKSEKADIAHLADYAKGRFEVVVVEKQTKDQEKISSSRIRELLAAGDIEAANNLLGFVYETRGVVVHGDARGRELGYPTANIQVDPQMILPTEGVYVNEILVGKTWYKAMGSIGHNDTFEANRPLTVELNILDFQQDIYGEKVAVRWYHMLRGQVAFDSVEGLITQLAEDKRNTADYFSEKSL